MAPLILIGAERLSVDWPRGSPASCHPAARNQWRTHRAQFKSGGLRSSSAGVEVMSA